MAKALGMAQLIVSVVMPVYNAERYLAEAVESVLAQTFKNFELIVVDDGSTDRSPFILEDFRAKDSRVRIITRPNTGIVGALNDGLAAASGEFIARADADDVSLPERFERQLAFLQQHPDYAVVGTRVLCVDPDGAPLRELFDIVSHEEIDRRHFEDSTSSLAHPSVMMRADVVRSLGGYRKEFELAEDLDLWLRTAEHNRLANLREVLVHYRVHLESLCSTRRLDQRTIVRAVVANAHRRRGIPFVAASPPEPVSTITAMDIQRGWVWLALAGGYHKTAKKHAFAVVRRNLWIEENWRVLGLSLSASSPVCWSAKPSIFVKRVLCGITWRFCFLCGAVLARIAQVTSRTLSEHPLSKTSDDV